MLVATLRAAPRGHGGCPSGETARGLGDDRSMTYSLTLSLLFGAASVACAQAKDTAQGGAKATGAAPAPASSPSKWLTYDAATNTASFQLVAGTLGAKSPFNFNGYTDGEATLVVPSKAKVVINFVNEDGTPHSAEVIAGAGPIPNMAGDPAIPAAYTRDVTQGLAQGGKDTMRFTAPDQGEYRISCGVPGHGLSGMWIRFKVDAGAKTASFGGTKQQ
jgi:sulfocyanin